MNKYPQQKFIGKWVQNTVTADIVEWTKSFGLYLQSNESRSNPLSTAQIRKFFGELKRIQADYDRFIDDLPMLKAHLAYAVGRDKHERGFNKTKIKELYEEISVGLDAIRVGERKDFINFVKIVEAIVAFHKYHGGK